VSLGRWKGLWDCEIASRNFCDEVEMIAKLPWRARRIPSFDGGGFKRALSLVTYPGPSSESPEGQAVLSTSTLG
jgi:hypothetical protein